MNENSLVSVKLKIALNKVTYKLPHITADDLLNLHENSFMIGELLNNFSVKTLRYPSELLRFIKRNKEGIIQYFLRRDYEYTSEKAKLFTILQRLKFSSLDLLSFRRESEVYKTICVHLGIKNNIRNRKKVYYHCKAYLKAENEKNNNEGRILQCFTPATAADTNSEYDISDVREVKEGNTNLKSKNDENIEHKYALYKCSTPILSENDPWPLQNWSLSPISPHPVNMKCEIVPSKEEQGINADCENYFIPDCMPTRRDLDVMNIGRDKNNVKRGKAIAYFGHCDETAKSNSDLSTNGVKGAVTPQKYLVPLEILSLSTEKNPIVLPRGSKNV